MTDMRCIGGLEDVLTLLTDAAKERTGVTASTIPYMTVPPLADGRDINDQFVLVHKRYIEPELLADAAPAAREEK